MRGDTDTGFSQDQIVKFHHAISVLSHSGRSAASPFTLTPSAKYLYERHDSSPQTTLHSWLKDFSEQAVEFTLIPLTHPQPQQHTNPAPLLRHPVCTRHMYFVFQSPNIMHNASRLDQRSVCTASNIIANGKCAAERRTGSSHVLQLAVYYSVYLFVYFMHISPHPQPPTLPYYNILPAGTVLVTRTVC